MTAERKDACGAVWVEADNAASCPVIHVAATRNRLNHICRAHIRETGECLCPCGARRKVSEGDQP